MPYKIAKKIMGINNQPIILSKPKNKG